MDAKAEDYYEISPYVYCGGDPVNKGDYNGREVLVYIETTGVGHTFIATGKGENTTVYTYGRYGATDPSSGSGPSSSGEGVLWVKTGESAAEYVNMELNENNAHVFAFPQVQDSEVDAYFMGLFNSSNETPTGKYKGPANEARVIDQYTLYGSNCTTIALAALGSCGIDVISFYSISPVGLLEELCKQTFWEDIKSIFGIERKIEEVSPEKIKQEMSKDEEN